MKERKLTVPTVLECENLACRNEKNIVFSGLSMSVEPGQSHVVLSTPRSRAGLFLRICSTLMKPYKGRITWLGMSPDEVKRTNIEDIRRRIGFVHRGTTLISNMTIIDNLTLAISYHYNRSAEKSQARVRNLMERLALTEYSGSRPVELDHPKQRLAVYAREMIKNPQIFIFDSPMLDLDKNFDLVMEEIDRRRRQGSTAVLMSDLPDRVIKKWADFVLLIEENGARRLTAEQFDPQRHFLASTGVWAND